MLKVKYYWERSYPYLFSFIIAVYLWMEKISFTGNPNMNDAIDGVNTIAALIIGFLGAILPVILGMKNESKFVQYVFENDTNKLFLKYIRANIVLGLMLVLVSILMYFRDEYLIKEREQFMFCMWIALITAFLLSTYRCLVNMLSLIFSSDSDLKPDLYKISEEEREERENIQKKYSDN